ncbi:MAG TPA: DUF6210 family protein [Planctomycetota bacterium]|nr:DUF6210 family protein [Planctomycetota bacterium]
MIKVMLDPDGTADFGLALLVQCKTGVLYEHECKTECHYVECREVEGFLVPLESNVLPDLRKLFQFGSRTERRGIEVVWARNFINALKSLIAKIPYFSNDSDGEIGRYFLEFDEERVAELIDGWIPVKSNYGNSTLVFEYKRIGN